MGCDVEEREGNRGRRELRKGEEGERRRRGVGERLERGEEDGRRGELQVREEGKDTGDI